MLHRIFIAIDLPENVKNKILGIGEQWSSLPCRWVSKENLHITLAFLGNRNNQELEKILEIGKQIATENEPFSMLFNKICYGPGTKMPPRLIWIKGEKSESFYKLKTDMHNLFSEKIGFWTGKRDLLPHITIARIKAWEWRQLEPENQPNIETQTSMKVPVDSIKVIESFLKRGGPKYQVLQTFNL